MFLCNINVKEVKESSGKLYDYGIYKDYKVKGKNGKFEFSKEADYFDEKRDYVLTIEDVMEVSGKEEFSLDMLKKQFLFK